jgi:hypothetical protein
MKRIREIAETRVRHGYRRIHVLLRLGASQEAAAAADGEHDAPSGCFAWLPGDDRQDDLVVTLDDATSAVYSGFVVAEGGTASSFRALTEVIDQHGLFCELYTDRGSHYFHTPKAGEPVSKSVQTQSLPQRERGSGAPWRSSASATSRPIRPRRAGGPSAPSAPCRIGSRATSLAGGTHDI